ncbi:Permease cytosine/purine uracilthiamine allantoin [Penicillium samsonianum]|uniref:Permease cytosine/purine uracilthiamine allantoin n=1 Tax=Penicillium samsonianum TaxID=1882272 RepID=UPI0025493E61|nr:Permease cytosine/purine uracilthiamine allantoin [Penicillium samsonianum]KAJ6128112.1 Permease cytosine/purine uracilthiamine allantoin [Penicillium samsonianum]
MERSVEDEEKNTQPATVIKSLSPVPTPPLHPSKNAFERFNARLGQLDFFESRGIERVPLDERKPRVTSADYMQMALMWFSVNITANNMAVGMLGPSNYGLGFVDSALCATFGALLGAAGVAYMGTFGPASGNRTMVVARYFMGYYPSKICALLNIVIMLGYGMVDSIVGGQVLSAVAGNHMTVSVGVVIIVIVTWIVVLFGMRLFHIYERWAWIPQLIAAFVLIGSAGPKFDTSTVSTGSPQTVAGNRLSFFSLCLSSSVAWAPAGADFYKWKTFIMTFLGVGLALTFANLIGVGLGSGVATHPDWEAADSVSSGSLILAGYNGLGGFGKFLGVLVSLGQIANNVAGTYSASLGFQMLGRYPAKLPRWVWTCVGVIIYFVCALAGRNNLSDIFENWLALMGYWVCIYLVIALEEHFIFRPSRGFDWEAWADRSKLPLGLAAMAAFLIGWAGSIISMNEVYFAGPIAKMVGDSGSDLGIWVGSSWAMLAYPGLRWLELKKFNR